MLKMNKKVMFGIFAILMMAGIATAEPFFQLGNADRTYTESPGITCYLGRLYQGMPIYFCMWDNDGMDRSFFVNQINEMDTYYRSGGVTTTFTVKHK